MELRRLGRTDIDVSPIGLGTVKLGRDTGLKYAAPARMPTDEEAVTLLRTAHELGVNLIDTAPAYGVSEERLGRLLPQVAPRDQWVLSTKVGEVFDPVTAASTYDFSPAHIRESVERSLRRLKTDAIDIYLLHFASSSDLDEQTLRAGDALLTLYELYEKGLIRAVGASTGTLEGGKLAASLCHVLMITLNAADQSQIEAVEAAHRHSCGVLLKKPLASGRADVRTLFPLMQTPAAASAVIGTTNPANLRAAVEAVGSSPLR